MASEPLGCTCAICNEWREYAQRMRRATIAEVRRQMYGLPTLEAKAAAHNSQGEINRDTMWVSRSRMAGLLNALTKEAKDE